MWIRRKRRFSPGILFLALTKDAQSDLQPIPSEMHMLEAIKTRPNTCVPFHTHQTSKVAHSTLQHGLSSDSTSETVTHRRVHGPDVQRRLPTCRTSDNTCVDTKRRRAERPSGDLRETSRTRRQGKKTKGRPRRRKQPLPANIQHRKVRDQLVQRCFDQDMLEMSTSRIDTWV